MLYSFNLRLLDDIRQAFISAILETEQQEYSCPAGMDYLFIKFEIPIITPVIHGNINILPIIFFSDTELSRFCNNSLESCGCFVELGFRWHGACHETKTITISGFALKIIYHKNQFDLRSKVFEHIFREIEAAKLITNKVMYTERVLSFMSSNSERIHTFLPKNAYFFKPYKLVDIDPDLSDSVAVYISENISSVLPAYIRENEAGINPAYQNINAINRCLQLDEKKIWLFRSDFILAVGNKNSNWTCFKENGLPEAIDPELHGYINWEDRYGHPSLALPYDGYDGSVFYGGYLAQRNGYIDVYLFSGRYHRNDLDVQEKTVLEAYIAYHFQNAYGNQPIIFIDAVRLGNEPSCLDNFEFSIFISNHPLPEYCISRSYDRSRIQEIFDSVEVEAHNEHRV